MSQRVFRIFLRLLMAIVVVSCMNCVSFARTANEINDNEKIVVDRIEGKYAVCQTEDGEKIDVRVTSFKTKPKEGDIFRKKDNEKFVKDKVATTIAKWRMSKMVEKLFK